MSALVLLSDVEKQVAAILEAGPDDGSFAVADASQQNKYHPSEITKAALFIDNEIVEDIIDTPGHGDRGTYLVFTTVTSGAAIPAHPGKVGSVQIQYASGAWRPGNLVKSAYAINKLLTNPNGLYGTTAQDEGNYYVSEEDILYFVGSAARIRIAPDLAITGACQAPAKYTAAVIRGTVAFLRKSNEVATEVFDRAANEYQRDRLLIRGDAAALPPLEAYKKQMGG